MKFLNAKYIKGAVRKNDWIKDNIPEFCLLGRSNVGKSSFLNFLTNNYKLSKISSTPGKTKLLNFFSFNNDTFRVVDCPGYGYSKTNRNMKVEFHKIMDKYLLERENLKFVVLLLDLRHRPNSDDLVMYKFLKYYNLKTVIIATKLDKLKKNDIKKNIKNIKDDLKFDDQNDYLIPISNTKNINRDLCWEYFFKLLDL